MATVVDRARPTTYLIDCATEIFTQPTDEIEYDNTFVIRQSVADGHIRTRRNSGGVNTPIPTPQPPYPVIDFDDFWTMPEDASDTMPIAHTVGVALLPRIDTGVFVDAPVAIVVGVAPLPTIGDSAAVDAPVALTVGFMPLPTIAIGVSVAAPVAAVEGVMPPPEIEAVVDLFQVVDAGVPVVDGGIQVVDTIGAPIANGTLPATFEESIGSGEYRIPLSTAFDVEGDPDHTHTTFTVEAA